MRHLIVSGLIVALAGCATPQTPSQTVYAMESDFAAALSIAGAYHDLPACPGPVLCRDATTMVRVQAAALAAGNALGVAQTAVRGGANATTAILTAQGAIVALQSLTAALKVQ